MHVEQMVYWVMAVYLHWPADDQIALIGSVGQSHAWLRKPAG